MFYTYLYFRKDGTPYYVGKGKKTRAFDTHRHTRRPKDRARVWVQYWESEEKAFEMEKWWISFYGRKDAGTGILRNLTDGGEGSSGHITSDKTKKSVSEKLLGIVRSKETISRMSEGQRLRERGELTKSQLENLRRMSEINIGKSCSIETREKISKAQRGRKYPDRVVSPEHKERARTLVASRWSKGKPTHCKNGHEYMKENTYIASNGSRVCRVCKREWLKKKRSLSNSL